MEMVSLIASLLSIIGSFIAAGMFLYNFVISKIIDKKPIDRLMQSLEKGNSITTKEELQYQIKYYVPQKFNNNGKIMSLKDLTKNIWKLSGTLYAITGKPASGKTTALRKLYCEMVKKQKRVKCIFFNMSRITKDEDLANYLSDLISINKLEKNDEIIAFFDGVDEAISFIGNDKFRSIFLDNGTNSEIFQLFREKELNLRGMVFGLRTEFLDRAENGLKNIPDSGNNKYYTEHGNYYMEVFRLETMTKKDIIKIYKSLRVLKAYDKKRPVGRKRHQEKYPEFKEQRKYIKLFKDIIKNNQSIFYYPMYVRYAYIYMQEYEKDWDPYRSDILMSRSNMTASVEILIRAILKWEFHIYNAACNRNSLLEQNNFFENMQNCMYDVIENMLEPGITNMPHKSLYQISREKLERILNNHSLTTENQENNMIPVLSHCLMTSDESGQIFEFSHFTLYEYFFAKYLLYKADFKLRKKYLSSSKTNENFLHIYYDILYRDKKLYAKSFGNIHNYSLQMFIDKKSAVKIIDTPQNPIIEIHNYLPFINEYLYHDNRFTYQQLEEIYDSKVLDISNTGWDNLEYAKGIVYPKDIENLNLYGLPLKKIDTLEEYINLKHLDIRISNENTQYIDRMIQIIRKFSLQSLYINTEDGAICEIINDMIERKELFIRNIYADTPDYSKAHLKIYQLKQKAEQQGQASHFYICNRTSWSRARMEYNKNYNEKDPDLLRAVFELEADDNGVLGLKDKSAEATFWNGLALAEYYLYYNWKYMNQDAYKICIQLEPYIPLADNKLSVYFGIAFGKALFGAEDYKKARQWFTNSWQYYEKYLGEESIYVENDNRKKLAIIDLGLNLYETNIRCYDKLLKNFGMELIIKIKRIENFQENENYIHYLQLSIADEFENWEKEGETPNELSKKIDTLEIATKKYTDKNNSYKNLFYALFYAAIYSNRTENTRKSVQLLNEMQTILQKEDWGNEQFQKHGCQIEYWEQKTYYLLLTGKKEETIKVIDELINYPYRTMDKAMNDYNYIRNLCLQDIDKDISKSDRHRLWHRVWF